MTEPTSDRDYWPDLDLQAVNDDLSEYFTSQEAEHGGPVIYPDWAIRRFIASELLRWAGDIDPTVNADVIQTLAGRPVLADDPDLNEAFDGLLQTHHLTEPFQLLYDGFTS